MNTATDPNDPIEIMGEIAGQMHAAIDAFNQRLGETMAQLRLTTNEQRAEGIQALEHLQGISKRAETVQVAHQELVKLIERQWPDRLDSAARSAGEAQAQAFGAAIVTGIQTPLAAAGEQARRAAWEVSQASHALRWKATVTLAALTFSCSAIVVLCLSAWSASVRSDVQSLLAERDQLMRTIDTLKEAGGELDVAHCAPGDERLCMRTDPQQRFGPRQDYVLVKFRGRP